MTSTTSRKPDASTIALALSIGLALFVAGYYFVGWLNRPDVVDTPDFNVAETRRGVVFVKCLTPGLPPAVGSGFIVSTDGLIYTNRHVVEPDYPIQGSIILVGVPAAADPDDLEYFQAELVYVAPAKEALDFAVLKIAPKPGYGSFNPVPLSPGILELGDSVAVFGYPFITSDQHVLSFTRGIVSATRVVLDEHPYCQTDAAVNPGNSGGPLVNLRGEAVGIVTLRKANANNMGYALYLKDVHLAAALAKNRAAEQRPRDGPLDPSKLPRHPSLPPEAWQIVRGEAKLERGLLSIENDGGAYWITAKDELPQNFQVVMNCKVEFLKGHQFINNEYQSIFRTLCVRFGTADIALDIMDRRRGTRVEFSLVHSFLWQQARLVSQDNRGGPDDPFLLTITRQAGAITVAVDQEIIFHASDDAPRKPSGKLSIGGCLSKLQLGEVNIIEVRGDRSPAGFVKRELPKNSGEPVRKVSPSDTADPPRLIDLRPPDLKANSVERLMPAKIADIAVGGAGRYFVLHLPTRKELAIFDLNVAQIVHSIPLKEAHAKFTAGLDKLLIALPDAGQIERWDLATGAREDSAPIDLKQPLMLAVMGSASRGPLLIGAGEGPVNTELAFLDVQTLKPLDIKRTGQTRVHLGKDVQVRASADGAVFAISGAADPPRGLTTLGLGSNEARAHHADAAVGYAVPGPDGRIIYTGIGRYTQDAKPIGRIGRESSCLPADQGVYALGFNGPRISVRVAANDQPIAPDLPDELMAGIDLAPRGDFPGDQRVHFVPSANVLVTIPGSNDRLILHRFNADEALAKSGIDYLIVTSLPPIWFHRGSTYRYQIDVKSRKGGLEYFVIAPTKGLTVSKTGLVTWAVPRDYADSECDVVIGIRDQRQEVRHEFKVVRRD